MRIPSTLCSTPTTLCTCIFCVHVHHPRGQTRKTYPAPSQERPQKHVKQKTLTHKLPYPPNLIRPPLVLCVSPLVPCVAPLVPCVIPLVPCVAPLVPCAVPLVSCAVPLVPCVVPLVPCVALHRTRHGLSFTARRVFFHRTLSTPQCEYRCEWQERSQKAQGKEAELQRVEGDDNG